MPDKAADILARVNHLEDGDSSQAIYDAWSEDYDSHLLEGFGYISPGIAAQALASEIDDTGIDIIDYGCGTGLVAEALKQHGFAGVDGIDISPGMLDRAASKRVYRALMQGDLSAGLALASNRYDAAVCVGSMGAGHVGAQQLAELLRPLRVGGIFVIIINAMHYAPEGFAEAFEAMQSHGLWRIRRLEQFNYMTELDRPGWLLVAEKS